MYNNRDTTETVRWLERRWWLQLERCSRSSFLLWIQRLVLLALQEVRTAGGLGLPSARATFANSLSVDRLSSARSSTFGTKRL